MCLLSGFIAIAITGSVAAAFAHGKQTNQEQVSNSGQQGTSSAAEDWSKSPIVKQGDIQIEVTGSYVRGVYLRGAAKGNEVYTDPPQFSDEKYLQIYINIKNTSPTKKSGLPILARKYVWFK